MSSSSSIREKDRLFEDILTRLRNLEELVTPAVPIAAGGGQRGGAEAHKDSHEKDGGDEIDPNLLSIDIPNPPTGFDTADITAEHIVDADGTTHAWFIITIPRVDTAAGYVLSYRKTGTTEFVHIMVEQPDTGNPEVKTGFVELDTVYYFKICSLNAHNQGSAWTSEVTKTSTKDTTAPSVPTGLSANGLAGGILLEWTEVYANDFSHYNVYVSNTTTPPALPTFRTRQNYCYYKTNDYGTTKYIWISSEDVSTNESDKTAYVSASASKIGATDLETGAVASEHLKKGIQPYNSDLEFTPKTGDKHDSVSWATGTIKFADGGQQAINTGSFDNLTVGIHYIYFTYGSNTLSQSTVYSDILGDTKGLLAIVGIVSDTEQEVFIQPFYSKGLNIVADVIAANAIFAEAIQANAIETDKLAVNSVTSAKTNFIIGKDNILRNGGFELDTDGDGKPDDWEDGAGTRNSTYSAEGSYCLYLTYGNTAKSLKYTIDARKVILTCKVRSTIASGQIRLCIDEFDKDGAYITTHWSDYDCNNTDFTEVSHKATLGSTCRRVMVKFEVPIVNNLYIDAAELRKMIKSDQIIQISADKILIDGVVYLSNWRHGTDVTKIDGGKIYTGSVLAEQIGANQIVIGKLGSDTLARIFSGSSVKTVIEAWRHTSDLTLIDGGDIYAQSVTSKKLGLERISSQSEEDTLAPLAGNLWFRDDVDQLRFRTDTEVTRILKEPIYSVPSEKLAPNAEFEQNRAEKWSTPGGDQNGVEHWMPVGWDYGAQNPTVYITTNVSASGKQCIACFLGGLLGWYGIKSTPYSLIRVKPNRKYFFQVSARGGIAMNSALSVIIQYADKDGNAIPGENDYPLGLDQDVTNIFQTFSGEVESPSNAKYVTIFIGISTPSINNVLLVDDVIFSMQKAIVPTAEVVAAASNVAWGIPIAVAYETWTKIREIVVPSTPHEVLFVKNWVTRLTTGASMGGKIRVKANGINYPSDSGITVKDEPTTGEYGLDHALITIPRDVNGLTIELWFYTTLNDNYQALVEIWGHSPHKHQ